MRKRLLFAVGIAVGYIVGARAGRPAYDAVVERVRGAAGSPTAQRLGEKAKATLEDKAPQVAEVVEQAASTAAGAAAAASDAAASDTESKDSDSSGADTDDSDSDGSDTDGSNGSDAESSGSGSGGSPSGTDAPKPKPSGVTPSAPRASAQEA